MEFSYRVTPEDYKQAFQLRRQQNSLVSRTMKTVMFWVFILVCLTLLWSIVQRKPNLSKPGTEVTPSSAPISDSDDGGSEASRNPGGSEAPAVQRKETGLPRALLFNFGPFVMLAAIWFFILKNMNGKIGGLLGVYNRDPLMQGQFTVNVTSASISIQNTAGFAGQLNWYLFESWREGKSVIVLNYKSGNFNVLVTAALSESQKSEVRGILSAALPQK